jgi:hypothetical protein
MALGVRDDLLWEGLKLIWSFVFGFSQHEQKTKSFLFYHHFHN